MQWLVTDEARSAWQQYRNILEQAAAAQITTMPAPLAASELLPGSKQQHRQQEQQQPQNNKRPHPDAAGAAGIGATNGPNSPTAKRRCTTSTSSAAAEPAANAAGHSSQAAQQPTTAIDAVNSAPQQSNQPATLADVCDTVGAVVVDASGRVAAGVSSGGLALKAEGRVGEAAVIGAGCWAADGTWRSTQRASQSAGLGSSDAADNGQDKGTLPGTGAVTCTALNQGLWLCEFRGQIFPSFLLCQNCSARLWVQCAGLVMFACRPSAVCCGVCTHCHVPMLLLSVHPVVCMQVLV